MKNTNSKSSIEKAIKATIKPKPIPPDDLIKRLAKKGHTEKEVRDAAWGLLGRGEITVDREMKLKLTGGLTK